MGPVYYIRESFEVISIAYQDYKDSSNLLSYSLDLSIQIFTYAML